MPVGCPLSDGEYSGMPSLFHALSGVRLIVAACFDVPIPILPECLVCRPECPTMHGKGMRNIISYPSRKVSVFGLYGRKNRLRHYLSMLIGLIPIPNKDMQQAVPLLSFSVYYINYMVLHCITYTFFSFIPCFFSLSEYLFYNQSMYYTKLHGITSCITLSAL